MNLFFDTETTGIANFKLSPAAPTQPRLVQLGAILTDNTGRVVTEINVMVKPEGFAIPKEASDIHGITTELASEFGFRLDTVLSIFYVLTKRAQVLVCHNFDYDNFIIKGELERAQQIERLAEYCKLKSFCTMKASTNLCKIPGPYGFKWPKLQEAYKFFFNAEFEGAHDAMADVRACQRLFNHLQTLTK